MPTHQNWKKKTKKKERKTCSESQEQPETNHMCLFAEIKMSQVQSENRVQESVRHTARDRQRARERERLNVEYKICNPRAYRSKN